MKLLLLKKKHFHDIYISIQLKTDLMKITCVSMPYFLKYTV